MVMRGLSRITLETIVKAIPAGVVVIEKEKGTVCYVNDHAIQLFGANPRGFKIPEASNTIVKLFTLDGEVYPSEKFPALIALSTGEEATANLIIERPDGSRILVSVSARPIRDEEGKTVAAVGIFEDITEHKQFQVKLEEYAKSLENQVEERTKEIHRSEQNYRELYESFGEAFIATDWELNVIHWNKVAERITRVKASNALGKKVYAVFARDGFGGCFILS